MKKKKRKPPKTTALARTDGALPGQLAIPSTGVPDVVLDGQIVPGTGVDPLREFVQRCDARSRATMIARLDAAADFLLPGSNAATYPWATLDEGRVEHVVKNLTAGTDDNKRQASPATRNLTRAALRKMARVLFGLRLISVDERQRIDDVPPARGEREPRGRSLTPRELRKLFTVCRKDDTAAGRRDAALFAVLFGGGLRRDEASKLDLADVDAKGSTLRVQGKGNKDKPQPVGGDVVRAVEAWIAVRGDHAGPLFVTVDKFGRASQRRLDGKAIAWAVDKRARAAGIDPIKYADGREHVLSPHDLRRSFVTGLLEAGEDLSTVARAARHASVTTTSIYDRRGEKKVAEAVAKLQLPF